MPGECTSHLNILVADDDPVFRTLVQARLLHLDCRFHEAGDGGEAWRVTREHELGLALVDFEMPGLDGIALTRCLRSHPLTRHIPIVMCTSRTDGGAMQAALEAGVSSFLTKPINWSLFERHIHHLLQLSAASARGAQTIEAFAKCHAEKDAIFARLLALIDPALQRMNYTPGAQPAAAEAAALIGAYQRLSAEMQATLESQHDEPSDARVA